MKTIHVNYTPLPPQVPRQLAIDILHSHGEVITLNPLVIEYHPIKPPRDAPNDEYYSTWYEIVERIKFIPGIGSLGSGKVSFKGVFHDMPWGIQTHMYVPLGIELRHKWQVKGNQSNEPPETREMGSKAPSTGLYLEENVEITCNPLTISFVKKELKAASKVMVDRMLKKAELLDRGVLQAMFEDGKLKTINPADRSSIMVGSGTGPVPHSPNPEQVHPALRYRPSSMASQTSRHSSFASNAQIGTNPYGVPNPNGSGLAIEMLGDTHFSTEVQSDANKSNTRRHNSELPADVPDTNDTRFSYVSTSDGQQSQYSSNQSRPNSFYPSPVPEQKAYASELSGAPAPYQHSPYGSAMNPPQSPQHAQQRYNPQDYARFAGVRYT